MESRIQFAAALFLIFASMPTAQALEDCAEFLVVSYNQQKMIQSLYFDTGNPSSITIKSSKTDGYHFWFPKDHNESVIFDVIVHEPYGYLKQGEILFRETEELKWYVKEESGTVYYNCSAEGKGLTDWFTFQFFKDKQISLSDGTALTANFSLVSSNNASNAFTFPEGTVGSEFLVLTQNMVKQNLARYKAGTIFFKTQKGYTAIVTDNYPQIQYVGCCATRMAPTAVPTAASPTPTPVASPTQVPTPSPSLVVSQAASPSPSPQPQLQFDFSGIALGAVILIALIVLAVFALKPAKKK